MKGQPRRDWSEANRDKRRPCRVCGSWPVELAHVVSRANDKNSGYRVLADRVVPLCQEHHGAYDRHELDLLPYLTLAEQVQAVIDSDGLELARRRTAPSCYRVAA